MYLYQLWRRLYARVIKTLLRNQPIIIKYRTEASLIMHTIHTYTDYRYKCVQIYVKVINCTYNYIELVINRSLDDFHLNLQI